MERAAATQRSTMNDVGSSLLTGLHADGLVRTPNWRLTWLSLSSGLAACGALHEPSPGNFATVMASRVRRNMGPATQGCALGEHPAGAGHFRVVRPAGVTGVGGVRVGRSRDRVLAGDEICRPTARRRQRRPMVVGHGTGQVRRTVVGRSSTVGPRASHRATDW